MCLQGAGPSRVQGFQKHLAFITANKACTQHWINGICKSELIMHDTTSPQEKTKDWVNIVGHDLCNCTKSRLGFPWFLAACVGSLLLQSSLRDSDEQEEKRLVSSSTASTWSGEDSLLLLTVKMVENKKVYLNPFTRFVTSPKARQHAAGCNCGHTSLTRRQPIKMDPFLSTGPSGGEFGWIRDGTLFNAHPESH